MGGNFSRKEAVGRSYGRECEKANPEVSVPSGRGPGVSEIFYSEFTRRCEPLALPSPPSSTLSVDLSLP